MNKPVFICLEGIDGSGKTSLAGLLVQALCQDGLACQYVYGGFRPWLLRPVRLVTSRLRRRDLRNTDYVELVRLRRNARRRFRFLSRCYSALNWLDHSLQVLVRVAIPLMLGRTVVADRYLFDTAINLDLQNGGTGTDGQPLGNLEILFRVLPRPTLLYVIDIDEEVAFARKSDTPALMYLTERRRLYLNLAEHYSARVIDGTAPREEQLSRIRRDMLALSKEA